MLSADQPTLDPPDATAGTPVCEAPACSRPLTLVQFRKGARACSAACRARAFRQRRRAAVLARIDALARELAAMRADVERW